MFQLLEWQGGRTTRRLNLENSVYNLGRDKSNDICFDSIKVSRFHAKIIRTTDGYKIIDLKSSNHTYVNGKQIQLSDLRSGDHIELASLISLVFIEIEEYRRKETTAAIPLNYLIKEELIVDQNAIKPILKNILEKILKMSNTDRGFIALVHDGKIQLDSSVSVNMNLKAEIKLSNSAIEYAIVHRKDKMFGRERKTDSMIDYKISGVICGPLIVEDELLGVLYLDTCVYGPELSRHQLVTFRNLSDQAAVAIKNSSLYLNILHEKDKTEMKIIEKDQLLEESAEMFKNLTEYSSNGIFLIKDGQFHYCNDAGRKILGGSLKHFMSKLPKNQHRMVRLAFGLDSGPEQPYQMELTFPNDSRFFELHTQPLRHGGRQGFILDVTEHRQLQRSLEISQRMESLGTLAGGIAHDFNNLLQVVSGAMDFISFDLENNPASMKAIDDVRTSCSAAAKMTDELLVLGKRRKSIKKFVNINESILKIINLLNRTLPKRIKCHAVLPRQSLIVEIAPEQLSRALLNLGINARDAIGQEKAGEIKFRAFSGAQPKHFRSKFPWLANSLVTVQVQDNGQGMDEMVRRRIFEPFFSTKKGQGTGLGLSTVYSVVREAEGAVDVLSKPGEGSIFSLYFPMIQKDGQSNPLEQKTPPPVEISCTPNLRLLLVEDQNSVRQRISAMLRKRGYAVAEAGSGLGALEQIPKFQPQIVIMDGSMPEMDGFECSRRLMREQPSLPIIMMSGAPEPPSNPPLGGWPPILLKPFAIETLIEMIEESQHRSLEETDKNLRMPLFSSQQKTIH